MANMIKSVDEPGSPANLKDMDKQSYKVKEFDLEQAKAGMLLCTRDGREVQVFD